MTEQINHTHAGMRKGRLLCASALASMLLLNAGAAWADAFGGNSNDPGLVNRIDKLEQELKALRDPAASGKLALPTPPDKNGIPAAPAAATGVAPGASTSLENQPYVMLGKLNGKILVKQDNVRFLLTPAEFAQFAHDATTNMARRRIAPAAVAPTVPAVPGTAVPGTQAPGTRAPNPPAPPPLTSPAAAGVAKPGTSADKSTFGYGSSATTAAKTTAAKTGTGYGSSNTNLGYSQ